MNALNQSTEGQLPPEARSTMQVIDDLCGRQVRAAYLFGSAVLGGLRPDSDVDVLVVLSEKLSESQRRELVGRLLAISCRRNGARPVELTILSRPDVVPWNHPPVREFIFGEWLREEYEQGFVPGVERDPDLTVVLRSLRENHIVISGDPVEAVLDPVPLDDLNQALRDSLPGLLDGMVGDERNVLLTLARMWVTMETGNILPKDVAAAWAMQRLPAPLAESMDHARVAYLHGGTCDWTKEEIATLVRELRGAILSGAVGRRA